MKNNGTERSSILLLTRNTVLLGALALAVVCFGLGFLFGYRGSERPEAEPRPAQPVQSERPVAPAIQEATPEGERRVLEPAPAPSEAAPKAPAPPAPAPKAEEKRADQPRESRAAGASSAPTRAASSPAQTAAASGRGAKKEQKEQQKEQKKQYSVQFGAFPDKGGAEQLRQQLKEKGYKAYIVPADKGSDYYKVRVGAFTSKKEADRAATRFRKDTAMQSFVTAAD